MRCLITLLAIAAAFTLAFSPTVRRALFARDLPPTPADHVDKYVIYRSGRPTYEESI